MENPGATSDPEIILMMNGFNQAFQPVRYVSLGIISLIFLIFQAGCAEKPK
jgi:hypothetical protein